MSTVSERDDPFGRQLLADIVLESLTANPPTIRAFETCELRWQVRGAQSPYIFYLLDGVEVEQSGRLAVRPPSTRGFTLQVRVGQPGLLQRSYGRTLGGVTVEVDLDACTTFGLTGVVPLVEMRLRNFVERSPDNLRFRQVRVQDGLWDRWVPGGPEVHVDPSGIEFWLRLEALVDNKPNPDVDIHTQFTFAVVEAPNRLTSTFRAVFNRLDVRVTFPWWAWSLPGAIAQLPVEELLAQERAQKAVRSAIQDFADELLAFVPYGRRAHSIRFSSELIGIIDILHCPPPIEPGLTRS